MSDSKIQKQQFVNLAKLWYRWFGKLGHHSYKTSTPRIFFPTYIKHYTVHNIIEESIRNKFAGFEDLGMGLQSIMPHIIFWHKWNNVLHKYVPRKIYDSG